METDPSKSGSSMVPVAIGLAGVALGAIAIFTAIAKGSSAATDIAALKQSIADDQSNITAVQQLAQSADSKASPLAQEVSDVVKSQQQMIPYVQADHDALKALSDKVDHLGARPAGTGGSSTVKNTVVPGQGGDYTVESGDTPTSIGKKFSVSAQAILDDNPGLNPNRMHPGDKIHIPAAGKPAPATHSTPPPATTAPAATTAP